MPAKFSITYIFFGHLGRTYSKYSKSIEGKKSVKRLKKSILQFFKLHISGSAIPRKIICNSLKLSPERNFVLSK